MKVALVAGESSGDMLGAGLVREISALVPDAQFEGIAGPRMSAEGASSFHAMESISIMGLDGLFSNLRHILSIRNGLYEHFLRTRPDVFVGIDVPDFNLGLEYRLRRAGIPTVHYVSPTVWAWRRYRIRRIRKAVGHMMTLFPFEEAFYRQHGVPVTFVGHPLADRVEAINVAEARDRLGLPAHVPVVALLPGSRGSEISRLGELFIRVARQLLDARPNLHLVVPCASSSIRDRMYLWARALLPPERVILIDGNAQMAMRAADVALLASGTAALEAALLCTPMVVAYRVSTMSFLLVKSFSTVKHYSMPNHLLEHPIVPEFIQSDATCDNLVHAVAQFLDNENKRDAMRASLAGIRERLALGADARAAGIVIGAARGGQ